MALVAGGNTEIAVIGMSGRFPGARNPQELWRNIAGGVASIRRLRDADLLAAGVDATMLADPRYVKAAAILDDLDQFDAGFFGFTPREASIMDPQHRHFLECAWEALENAGHVPDAFKGTIGVYAGCGMNAYFTYHILTNAALMRSVGFFLARHTGNDKDFLTTRVSYCFNLTGPSLSVQTACSTSLVAIHIAAQNLLAGECDMALAGGVTIELPHGRGYVYEEGEILSPDGHCRAFDAEAKGTVFGSGAGVVVLRRLQDAIDDGDCIYAVIKGSAINNDGSAKVGYLAPSVDGQSKAILEALAVAGVKADTISYVETHGTGTPVGDPIEIAALTQAFRKHTQKSGFCGIGSLKTNIGHLDTAAGVASFIKAVQALRHKQLPPSLHFTKPNPAIPFAETPFFVNTTLTDWKTDGAPRRAGVSSLGVGGTNAHVILEEAPKLAPTQPGKRWQILALSARSGPALDAATARLHAHFESTPDVSLADAAWTLQVGRKAFAHRRVLACRDMTEARAVLGSRDPNQVVTGQRLEGNVSVTFLFPGGGAQYPNMGLELYREEAVFRQAVDRCLETIHRQHAIDLRPLLFPAAGLEAAAAESLEQPSRSILSVFTIEYALAQLWMSWGVVPAAMTGHSLGEYTAACLAGVLSLEDAIAIVAWRGELFDKAPAGAMLSVPLAEADLLPLLGSQLSIAAVNGPQLCVASGSVGAIESLERALDAKGIETGRVHIAIAAHSQLLEPFLDEFRTKLSGIRFQAPNIPYISNVTGTWARAEEVATPGYWVRHLRSTVRFSAGLGELLQDKSRVYLEVGPGTTLSSLVRLHLPPAVAPVAVVSSLRHPQEVASDLAVLYTALGRLWIAGLDVDWARIHDGVSRRRLPLPTYPFEHERHWVEAGDIATLAPARQSDTPTAALKKLPDMRDWFFRPGWRRAGRRSLDGVRWPNASRWLVFADDTPLCNAIIAILEAAGQECVTVETASRPMRSGRNALAIDPGHPAAYRQLLRELIDSQRMPARIVHLWESSSAPPTRSTLARLDESTERGFGSLLFLAQALVAEDVTAPLEINVIVVGAEQVAGEPVPFPERALATAPMRVIARELPGIRCRAIDVDAAAPRDAAHAVLAEVLTEPSSFIVALRAGEAWTPSLERAPLEASLEQPVRIKSGGAYLITGGFGGIGWTIAEHLATVAKATLVLVGRTLPPDVERRRARLAQLGGTLLPLAADVADLPAMRSVAAEIRQRVGTLDGIFHAAGVIDDGPLALREPEAVERVLRPKVRGALVLDALCEELNAGFLVLFSSTSSSLGLAGQFDYAAANAFLNALARSRASRGACSTLALQWGVWQEVGMAARALAAPPEVSTLTAASAESGPTHPLLGAKSSSAGGRTEFRARYSPQTHWLLDEHRLAGGRALVPGTGYIEICRAAAAEILGTSQIEIRDLVFLAPLEVGDRDTREVLIAIEPDGDALAFMVSTDSGEHCRGQVTRQHAGAAGVATLADIAARCRLRREVFGPEKGTRQERFLTFGPRWKNLEHVDYGHGEALGRLRLAPEHHAELAQFQAHPALLDLATACGLPLLAGYDHSDDLYVPFSYGRIRIHRPLTPVIYSHVRIGGAPDASKPTAVFDVTLFDEHGQVLLEVEEFTARRLSPALFNAASAAKRTGVAAKRAAKGPLEAVVAEGIFPDEGARALVRAIESGITGELMVSSIDPDVLAKAIDPRAERRSAARASKATPQATGSNASRDEVEQTLVAMWQELLGVEAVGADDDFFELGGHSLIAVRLVARIDRTFHRKLPLATLFEARTISQLAALLRDPREAPAPTSLVPIFTKGQRPPFYCVHSVGGEVLTYSELAALMQPDQPFYGLRARGHDGSCEPLTTIEEQAALYLKEMREAQPSGPYYIGGYSHGGRVVLEMAQQLVAAGETVGFVGVIDTWPSEDWSVDGQFWWRSAQNFPKWLFEDFAQSGWTGNWDRVRRLSRWIWKRVTGRAGAIRRTKETADIGDDMDVSALPESIRKTYQANFRAFVAYRPKVYPGRVTLFRATAQPLASPQSPDLNWGDVAAGGVEVIPIRGTHSSIFERPRVETLAAALKAALERAQCH